MKRIFALLAAVLMLLCGCSREPEISDSTAPRTTETVPPTTGAPPQSFGTYDADSPVEVLTKGTVKRYRLEAGDYYALKVMGEGVLLFSGEEQTTLTRLRREVNPVSITLTGCYLKSDSPTLRVWEEGICYYDEADHTLVTLDADLRETTRVSLPGNMIGKPVLSQDRQWLYYYVEDALRSLELRTGISRLLQESNYPVQQTQNMYFDGKVLQCTVGTEEAQKTVLISTQTGKTLQVLDTPPEMETHGDTFFARWYETKEWKLLVGTFDTGAQRLTGYQEGTCFPQLQSNALVIAKTDETGTTLTRYPLTKDQKISTVRLSGVGAPVGVGTEEKAGYVWFLSADVSGQEQALYCWEAETGMTEQTVTLEPYYTRQNPDKEGLKQCTEQAKVLAERYGIRIRLWEEAVSTVPEGYSLVSEYQVPVYQRYLTELETILQDFPKEIYTRLGKKSGNGKLTICLVSEVYGSNELGSLKQETGVHFWHNGNAYLTLTMNEQFRSNFRHELFHAIDSYVLTECKVYDFWETLNPDGFVYDYSYVTNEYRDPGTYLEKETRAFIDIYSMSYPREDRARVLEYAMRDDGADYFTSPIMQAKLRTLTKGIREAFKLKGDEYLWEQYLQEESK